MKWKRSVLGPAPLWSALLCCAVHAQSPSVRLELIPPSPVTNKISVDIRGAVENDSGRAVPCRLALYLDRISPATLLHARQRNIRARASAGVFWRQSARSWTGHHRLILAATCGNSTIQTDRDLTVLPSPVRSTRTIGGAWIGIVHWSDAEARYWNTDIRKLTDDDWRAQIRAMHDVGMNIVVIQEVFRNQAYYGDNHIATEGYHGLAYYPSALYPGRVSMTAHDPIEAVLSEADRLHMHVFLGVGMYAWFDFSPRALAWSEQVAGELWRRYGHHPSFYGWYISAEAYGSLIPDQGEADKVHYRHQVVDYFRKFQAWSRRVAPEKPVMLAPNTMDLRQSRNVWPFVLRHVDIVCPFGFDRMPPGDLTSEEAAQLWQSMCNRTGTHLWMDMEAFRFKGQALVPRPVGQIVQDLQRFPNFEEILCYQYSGLFNAPGSRIAPGGPPTVRLYEDYLHYLTSIGASR